MSGGELKLQRKRIGLTPEDVARFAGVSVATVERWESRGSSIPHALRLRVLLTDLELKRREVFASAPDRNFGGIGSLSTFPKKWLTTRDLKER